jgi:uncharacterized membrane protein
MTAITLAYTEMRMGAGDWFLMALGLLVFAALLLWLGASWAGQRHTAHHPPSEESAAQHLLDRRLAEGGITGEEHDQVRRILAGEHQPRAQSETADAVA